MNVHSRRTLAVIVALVLAGAINVLGGATANAQEATEDDVHGWVQAYAVWYSSPDHPYADLVADVERVASCESIHFDAAVINNRRLGRLGEVGVGQWLPGGIWRMTPQARAGYSVRDPEANVAGLVWAVAHDLGPHNWVWCWRNG